MADIVSESPQPLTRPQPVPVVSRRRFGAAYLALAAIVGAAVGLIVVFATRHDTHTAAGTAGARWSSWAPQTTGTLGAREIARYVSGHYHLENGTLFTSVIAGPMVIASSQGSIPVSAILVRSGTAGVTQERIDIAFPQSGIFFQLCGTGNACMIPGTATRVRGQLVRREAVELALYGFHYLPQTDYILAFLPPPQGVDAQSPLYHRVVLLSREALKEELALPITEAVPPGSVKMSPSSLPAAEGNAIDGLTAGRVFHYDFQQAADQSVLVVLSPVEG